MSDSESIKKMLRSVLQSSKLGVPVGNLNSEYRSLCGENIPLKKLGFSTLEDYLRSIPSVVKLEYRMGVLRCFASVCEETAHIAELVTKQKSSKKSGCSQLVNCKMRYKSNSPYMFNVIPRFSLRQPSPGRNFNWTANLPRLNYVNKASASGDYRQLGLQSTPIEHRYPSQPAVNRTVIPNREERRLINSASHNSNGSSPQIGPYDVELVQSRVKQLLEKYSHGVWMSKLPEVYSKMFVQNLHPQALLDLEKWPRICSVEKPSIANRADRLIYPALPLKPLTSPLNGANSSPSPLNGANSSPVSHVASTPGSSQPSAPKHMSTTLSPFAVPKTRDPPARPLAKPTFIFPPEPSAPDKLLPSVTLRIPAHNPNLVPQLLQNVSLGVKSSIQREKSPTVPTPPLAPTWTFLGSANSSSVVSSPQADDFFSPLKSPFPSPTSSSVVSAEVRQKIKELLSKYSQGVWAHALPKLFMDMYKMPFPEQILDNLALLVDICTIEYPLPQNKKKAILYNLNQVDMDTTDEECQQCRRNPLPSGLEVVGSVVPPHLALPSDQFPSVLVTEAKSCNAVTIRYVGENYSNAQEAMEDAMQIFYSQISKRHLVSSPIVGQLVGVIGEDGEEITRAQVMDVTDPNKVEVFYVDYGFSVETSGTNLLELHQDFLSLPFQATTVRLAGLHAYSSHSRVLSLLDKLAVGKILLMETLQPCQQDETPAAVLYDTSQEEDVNINSMCLSVLQDKTMNSSLSVNVVYRDVCVSSVGADGTIFCQLPSQGTARLSKLLEEIEAYFTLGMTSELLVSRPFSGMYCLARYKGKWTRAEITNMHGNRVMEILFIDLGVPATVEVTDLRKIPPRFLKDFIVIPPQIIKCRLADLTVPDGSHDAVMWLKEAVVEKEGCIVKITRLEEYKGDKVVYIHLFIGGDGQELHKSINHQLAQLELWQKLVAQSNNTVSNTVDAGLTPPAEQLTLSNPPLITPNKATLQLESNADPTTLPPPVELPQPGQTMDVFVPVACHPGYFVIQPWQDLHKLMVLMGEMVLYYNQTGNASRAVHIQKGIVYAAKIEKNWHRVQVKALLGNGLVNVYELDYGKHELVSSSLIQPLIQEFRQLPFQAVAAQLAGMAHKQWSEEASMLFRNHVEKKALVAQVESVRDVSEGKGELWERRLSVYLVDTSKENKDLWIHSIMADIGNELSSAA